MGLKLRDCVLGRLQLVGVEAALHCAAYFVGSGVSPEASLGCLSGASDVRIAVRARRVIVKMC